jgi:subfamily B ATP-binding cassette protein MsbA
MEPIMFFVCFGVFPVAIYPIQILGKKMRKVASRAQEELGNYTAKLDESFHSIKIVKSYLAEDKEVASAQKTTESIFGFYKRAAKLDALSSPIMEILSGIAVAAIIWYGGYLIIHNKTTPGALFAFLTAFFTAYRPYKSLVQLNVHLQEGVAAASRLFQILDTRPQVVDLPSAKAIQFTKSQIVFENVSLDFSSKLALHKANLVIEPHTTVALVGKSGSGKTTISNLLVRFYDPSSGSIRIDGNDLRDLTIKSLRSQVALVTQDTMLFDSSIAENIAYGVPNASRQDIVQAAKKAHADEFIDQLKDGYDTIIGYQGSTLSGGQKQRIAIARAFLKDAPILILDEATSALDAHSERAIDESLKELRQNRTTIIITHKLANITDVDNIIVMKRGVIIESGKHQDLIANKGEYWQLYAKQS